VLIHAGDFTNRGTEAEITAFNSFLKDQPHKHKVVIAGNHERLFETLPSRARDALTDAIYLEDSGAEIEGRFFWGSPWQPAWCGMAFNRARGEALARIWARIPEHTDVLITHSPPAGILDTQHEGTSIGCADLAQRLTSLTPSLHVFGHAHPGYGTLTRGRTTFVNAALSAADHEPLRAPIVIDI
jgi:hypothetical protein